MLAAMHLLRSAAIGTEIIDDALHEIHGRVIDLILDPDRGKILALLVRMPFDSVITAVQIPDITTWGKRIHVRDSSVLGPVEEIIRLKPFLEERRRIYRQPIVTKSGARIGICSDYQFSTEHFTLEWIFPKRFFSKGTPLPASEILEVTEEAIIVKDQGPREEKVEAEESVPDVESVIAPTSYPPPPAARNSSR